MCQYSGYLPGKFTYFAQSVTPGSLCHGNNIAQMPTIRTPAEEDCLEARQQNLK